MQPGAGPSSVANQQIVIPRVVPILPVRNTVLFPFAIIPLNVGRPKGRQLLSEVMSGDRIIGVFAQRDATQDDPAPADLYEVGTLANVLRMVRVSDDQVSVLLQGIARVRFARPAGLEPYLRAHVEPLREIDVDDIEAQALTQQVLENFERVVKLSPQLPDEAAAAARNLNPPARLSDFIASLFDLPGEDKQALLALLDVKERLKKLHTILAHQESVLEVGQQIQDQVRENIDQRQKEFVLRQQMEAIQKELGDGDETQRAVKELRERVERSGMPAEVRKEADRELDRLARMPAQAAEHTVSRTYLEWLCDMPWAVTTPDNLDLVHARRVLDEDHYGLGKIKERLLEFLAVRRFKADARTPILCFAGPPGTGKTSLGRSIARALGRKFVRQSLGGVRDEAEIRGHRRTYIGALPGQIIRGLKRAGTRNPVFMLDEIDKLTADYQGDPSSALLEVLDPEQNTTFQDHYLDVPFDLSEVLFVCTANVLDMIPAALRDRMEVIELASYIDREKLEIARRYLIPKAIRENGLESLEITIEDDAILKVVRDYTGEAGLRNLERELANLLRRTAKQVAEGGDPPRVITPARVRELLGSEKYAHETLTRIERPGQALGLAWTPVGGEVLMIEAQVMPGSKQLVLTGQLGEVMRESAQAALSFVRANSELLGIVPDWFEHTDLHVHLPSGAIPKDGPSAGITMCTAIVSLLTDCRMRTGIAMTGEITLLGRVLPIGGLKEKVLGAHRAGLKTVVIPSDNQRDLEDVPVEVRTQMIFAPVGRIEQVLDLVLENFPLGEEAKRERAAKWSVLRGRDAGQSRATDDGMAAPPLELETEARPGISTERVSTRRDRK
ncbi:MAG: endopeptidase La [Candidatus Eisenbacteria bacterium]|uniref:Lon protease n=1 Tax=Eiseniibacteriota bacterium TaxID=2212470 RepID=A0A849SW22_UNCEI|nr:endopeptidase La [Candidatus Eisenbacteria bacterium]